MSKVLIINSSYRKSSNSSALSASIAEGAQAKGHEVNTVDISKLTINPCHGCEACIRGTKGCVQKDGMQEVYPLIQAANIVIFTSPIYWFNMCGQLKCLIDRCFAIALPPSEGAPSPFAAKKIGLAMIYGDEDVLKSGGVNAVRTMQDICTYTGATWAGAIYGSAMATGEVKNNSELLAKGKEFGEAL